MKKPLLIACIGLSLLCLPALVRAQAGFAPMKEHALLKKEAGTWTAKGKMWMPGATEAMEFEGVEKNEMVGDLWVATDFKGNFGGVEFHGHGRLGFNVDSKKYEGTWFDSMSPHTTKMTGTYDEASKTLTMHSTGKGPQGEEMKGKNVVVYKDKDTRVMTMYSQDPNGGDKMIKTMQIVYTRKK